MLRCIYDVLLIYLPNTHLLRGRGSVHGVRLRAPDAVSAVLDVVRLRTVMELSSGSPEVVVGLIDGAVATNHADLAAASIRQLEPPQDGTRAGANHAARDHGTYVAGILSARRGSAAPAICPGCTLLVRRIFLEAPSAGVEMPSATPDELADAIVECVDAGARVLNLSVAVAQPSPNRERRLEDSLNYAAQRAALVVAAAGNQGTVGGSAITRHPWVIPVAACDAQGRPLGMTNLGSAIGRRGLMAPGDAITSLDSDGGTITSSGTSAATPFVTGTIALIWSIFRRSSAATIKTAVTRAVARRNAVVPPVVDAAAAYQFMTAHAMR